MLTLWLASSGFAWTLGQPHDLEGPVVIEHQMTTWTLDSGTVFPVFDDSYERAGFVFQGTSALDLNPGQRAPLLANRMVAHLSASQAEARRVGEGSLLTEVSGAVVLGRDAWEDVEAHAFPLRRDDDVWIREKDGRTSILVEGHRRRNRDRRQAQAWLEERTEWMMRFGVEPSGFLVADQWEVEAGTDAQTRWFGSLKTEIDWGLVAGDHVKPRVPQRWLEVWRDERGVLNEDHAEQAWAHGQTGPFFLAGEAPRAPDARLDATSMGVITYFRPESGGQSMLKGVTADIQVQAIGSRTVHAVIDLPHTEQMPFGPIPPLPNAFRVHAVTTTDGAALPWRFVSLGGQSEGRGKLRTLAIRLPDVLEPGEVATVRVSFVDRHRYTHLMEYGGMAGAQIYDFGMTTGLVAVLPHVRGHSAGPVPVTLDAGVARRGRTHVVASHDPGDRWNSNTGRWVRVSADSQDFALGVGKWHQMQREAQDGVPALDLHPLFHISGFEDLGEMVAAEIERLQPLLPQFPRDQVSIVEAHRDPARPYFQSATGLAAPGEVQVQRELQTSIGGIRLADLVIDQWWSGTDVDDPEITWALTWALALRSLEGTRGMRTELKDMWVAMRDQAPSVYAFGKVLEAEAGEEALLVTMRTLLQGEQPVSWSSLASALTEAGVADAQGFLTTWVHGDLPPAVNVVWDHDGERVHGFVEADLPFGAFTLPLEVGDTTVGVQVRDGSGTFTVACADRRPRVRADPEGTLPLRGSRVTRASLPDRR